MSQGKDEETFRDLLVMSLGTMPDGVLAQGEVYHREGRVDILVRDQTGSDLLIAECKLWRGGGCMREAVDQLMERYLNLADKKTALIIFNTTVESFTEIIEKARITLRSHQLFQKELGARKETSYSYLFRHPTDDKQLIELELLLFNYI